MLSETSRRIESLPRPLYDLDLAPSGAWIGVTEQEGDHQSLSFSGRIIPLSQPCLFPRVRAIDGDTAVVVDARTRRQEKNAWVVTSSGEIKAHFYAGDAVQDVLVSSEFIVVTYFDESALTSSGIEGNGVAVFNSAGEFLFGYKDLFGEKAVDVADCYAACWNVRNCVLFYPYTEFPLVSLDLHARMQRVCETPVEVTGSGAITGNGTLSFSTVRTKTRVGFMPGRSERVRRSE
ncbi:MAG: hypothetical protein AABN33_26475 [Acidobacteriota bacterium]